MKKILKKAGAVEEKIDYFKIRENTPAHLRKVLTIDDVRKQVLEARAEKLKKAS